jgi:putative pyruvate formate lyase activating enzyme
LLDNYFSILEGRLPARYYLASMIPAGPARLDGMREDELWGLHGEAMRVFREAWTGGGLPRTTAASSLLDLKIVLARKMLSACHMCERRCAVDRSRGETGFCGVGATPRIASDFLHFGEERELVPSHTVFFSGCTFRCVYCQNWDIAVDPRCGSPCEEASLALRLEEGIAQGARNANFVGGDPTPALPAILATLKHLGQAGKNYPIVWNSNMYASGRTFSLLDGVIDVYLGDFRYGNDDCATRYSEAGDYFAVVSRNFRTAHSQGEIMLRQLLLPGHFSCCTTPIMYWVADEMPDVYFNLMFQYRPDYRASLYPEIDRRLQAGEKERAVELARELGLEIGRGFA